MMHRIKLLRFNSKLITTGRAHLNDGFYLIILLSNFVLLAPGNQMEFIITESFRRLIVSIF